ncbi:MAG: N-acetylmuramoyl-L-alanine amidase [Candidatus Promineofilum sp.]|nr:N-acetylmuramoyl-L-alanine amidase [Promineifilum sp.]
MSLQSLITGVGIMFFIALPALSLPSRHQFTSSTVVETREFAAEELFPGFEDKAVEEGERYAFVSAAIAAPIPFNILIPAWQGNGDLEFSVRTSSDGETWNEWQHLVLNRDWAEPGDQWAVGDMVLVAGARKTNRHIQLRMKLDPAATHLADDDRESIRLTFVDSTNGPTTDEMVATQGDMDTTPGQQMTGGYPKPPIISREAWCKEPGCDYQADLEHAPVTHLIIHHTVTANGEADWAAIVRAIWAYHTRQNGWRDIGYNYLIDPNGFIYEGHAGGDDVVGIHASAANKGSMGVGLLGTFSNLPDGTQPPQPMLEAGVNLLSWKADQRGINIFESSRTLPNVPWGLPHLMGHRDVNGTTECPGDQAHLLIPWLREQIGERIGLTDPHLYVDEISSAFTRSSTGNWYVAKLLCGYNNHAWYTWTTTNPAESTNWGEWRITVPNEGRYRVEAYVPYCITNRSETTGATYSIHHAGGTTSRTISHIDNLGLWMSLGEYQLIPGSDALVRLTDLTATDKDIGIWFDALRLLRLDEPPDEAIVSIIPATQTIGLGGGQVCVQARVEKSPELHAFEFTLGFPPDLLEGTSVTMGPFLGSTGRKTHELAADIDNATGQVKFAAYTSGANQGPAGGGELATACFTPEKAGTAALNLTLGKLSGSNGAMIPVSLSGGNVMITSCFFADFDCNNVVDIFDVQQVAGRWGATAGQPGFDVKYDVVPSGEIDIFDIQKVASVWGWPED